MLTSEEEAALRESLRFREEDRWLHLLYRCATGGSVYDVTRGQNLSAAPESLQRKNPQVQKRSLWASAM